MATAFADVIDRDEPDAGGAATPPASGTHEPKPTAEAPARRPGKLGLWLKSLLPPLIGIGAFLALWAVLAPQVETSLGALPGPVDYAQIPELAQRGLLRVQQFFATLDGHLAGRAFVATDRFSVADITAVVAVDFARVVKVRPGEMHPHLTRWRAAMAERASTLL